MDYFFWLKKVIARACDPLTLLAVGTIIVFVVMSLKQEWQQFRLQVIGAVIVVVWLLSTPLVSHFLLYSLESEAGHVQFNLSGENVAGIVVLGCGHREEESLPLSSRYKECSLRRVVHAYLLHRETGIPMYFSGGVMPGNSHSEAEYNRKLALSLGADDASAIVVADESVDTASEAIMLSGTFTNKTVALVTSAAHMSRSRNYLESVGIDVITSPTDNQITFMAINYMNVGTYLPSKSGLKHTYIAFYEYAGLISQRIFGK